MSTDLNDAKSGPISGRLPTILGNTDAPIGYWADTEIDNQGIPRQGANPWLLMYWNDMKKAAELDEEVKTSIENIGFMTLFKEVCRKFDENQVLR